MTFPEFLSLLIIKPLELLFEIIYSIANRNIGNVAVSIVVLSLVVNLLVLPLYARADKIQSEASEKQKSMEKWVKHIRKTFRGEERLMMLQTYYRQNNYSPFSVILESVPLLLQIPFFIAAYNFLSGLEMLQGMPLGPIRDLSLPDQLFSIGSFPVNVLPILMTAINIVSGLIYTRNQPLKMKLQINIMALVFLVLLYRSPSGLVFYWTCNNLFSLGKNIVTEIIRFIKKKSAKTASDKPAKPALEKAETHHKIKDEKWIFFAGAAFMILLLGAYIPTNIIKASTQEFVEIANPQNPLHYLAYSVLYAAGTFGVWLGIFYFLARERGRRYFERGIWMVCAIAVTNYLVAGSFLGLISSSLQYSKLPEFGRKRIALSILISAVIIALFILIAKKNVAILKAIAMAGVASVFILTAVNMVQIGKDYKEMNYLNQGDFTPGFNLSRQGKNVMLIMMDRALGTEVPYIFKEKPELKESFDGFTYYPNTVSFGAYTNFGAPSLYGGYEYTPEAMNARDTEPLVKKHDEALSVLPVLFDKEGYKVTVCDPPYAGYYWIPDLTIYDNYPGITAFNTIGRFDEDAPEDAVSKEEIRRRNFYCHSLMKAAPLFLQGFIYDYGLYNNLEFQINSKGSPLYTSAGYNQEFLDSYLVLKNLTEMTRIEEEKEDTFLMLTNGSTHEPCLLQEPDYVPKKYVDNTEYHLNDEGRYEVDGKTIHMETPDQMMHFCVNTASFTELAKWFDYLRQNGVYDNTRIILVADHGRNVGHYDLISDEGVGYEYFMPLLMVKDFDAKGFRVEEHFMTNADTPSLLTAGIIDNAVNPFTNNPLDGHEKGEEVKVFYSEDWNTSYNNGNVFFPGMWYTVRENPYEKQNWTFCH